MAQKKPARRRNRQIIIRISDQEYRILKDKLDAMHISQAQYFRDLILFGDIVNSPLAGISEKYNYVKQFESKMLEEVRELTQVMTGISNSIYYIIMKVNAGTESDDDIHDTLVLMNKVWNQVNDIVSKYE